MEYDEDEDTPHSKKNTKSTKIPNFGYASGIPNQV